jgi:hypothetical protein
MRASSAVGDGWARLTVLHRAVFPAAKAAAISSDHSTAVDGPSEPRSTSVKGYGFSLPPGQNGGRS